MTQDLREKTYLEVNLPAYLTHDIEALVQGKQDDVSYVDCLLDEVYGSINCAEVDREITPEQALYLRQKYLWGRSTPE